MKIFDKKEIAPIHVIETMISEYVEEYLTSDSNTFVVYDGTAEVLFKGTLNECCAYKRVVGKDYLAIYSKEAYNKMINIIKNK